jgi:hypothetical protein
MFQLNILVSISSAMKVDEEIQRSGKRDVNMGGDWGY